jgi:hypothetical protein
MSNNANAKLETSSAPSVVIQPSRSTPNDMKDAMAKIGTSMIRPDKWYTFPPLPNPKNQIPGSDRNCRTRTLQFVENVVQLKCSPSVHELMAGKRVHTLDGSTDKIPFPDFGGDLWSAEDVRESKSPEGPLLLLGVDVDDYVKFFDPVELPPSTFSLHHCIGFIPTGRRTEVIQFTVSTIIVVLAGDIKFAWTTSVLYDNGPTMSRHSSVAELVHVTRDRDFHFVNHGRPGMGIYVRSGTCLQMKANDASTLLAIARNETAQGICHMKHASAKGDIIYCLNNI